MKVLIPVAFFVIANITLVTNLEVANAIAGVMVIMTVAMYVVDNVILKSK
jgi:hypothetical protein